MSQKRRRQRQSGPPGQLNPHEASRAAQQNGKPQMQRMKRLIEVGINERGHTVMNITPGVPWIHVEKAVAQTLLAVIEGRLRAQIAGEQKAPVLDASGQRVDHMTKKPADQATGTDG